jgi:hypothetical protein
MKRILGFSVLILLSIAMFSSNVNAIPPSGKTVQAHGQCTDIWVALSWVYIGTFSYDYPFLNHESVSGPWQVTAQPEADKAEFNAAVKTRVGVVKFELVSVESVEFDGSTLVINGDIKEKYKGNSFTWEHNTWGTKITIDLTSGDIYLDLNNDDNNLIGNIKSGNAHP